jgi:ribosomal protein S12 methylthiotransferase
MNVGLISLGCAKNRVDSEIILAMCRDAGATLVNDVDDADLVIINTCGFIKASQDESFGVIDNIYNQGKKVLIAGCLVGRFIEELEKRYPNATICGLNDYDKLHLVLKDLLSSDVKPFTPIRRVYTTEPFSAYLRISEGCNNRCSFCAIPLIRGSFRSRPLNELLEEVDVLIKNGKKEIILISQDTTAYGRDLKDGTNLLTLLTELCKRKEIISIRLLYLYPKDVTKELVDFIKEHTQIAPYFDLPFQHASNKMLRLMYRRDTYEHALNLIAYIRKEMPDAIIRTTFIVGFPGETEEDFKILLNFVREQRFNHLGVFTYSRELGTPSYYFKDQVQEEVKIQRRDTLMNTQKLISLENNEKLVGKVMEGFVTSYNNYMKMYEVRTYFNAPDDIDGTIYLDTKTKLNVGDIVRIEIISAFVYDLRAKLVSLSS